MGKIFQRYDLRLKPTSPEGKNGLEDGKKGHPKRKPVCRGITDYEHWYQVGLLFRSENLRMADDEVQFVQQNTN